MQLDPTLSGLRFFRGLPIDNHIDKIYLLDSDPDVMRYIGKGLRLLASAVAVVVGC